MLARIFILTLPKWAWLWRRLESLSFVACMQILCFNNKSLACKRRIFYANCRATLRAKKKKGEEAEVEGRLKKKKKGKNKGTAAAVRPLPRPQTATTLS